MSGVKQLSHLIHDLKKKIKQTRKHQLEFLEKEDLLVKKLYDLQVEKQQLLRDLEEVNDIVWQAIINE
jgi:hypothetical protein